MSRVPAGEAAWWGCGVCTALNTREGQIIGSAGSSEPHLNLHVRFGASVVVPNQSYAGSAAAANGSLAPVNSLAVQTDGLTALWGCQNTGIIVYRRKTACVAINIQNLLEFAQKEPVASIRKGCVQRAPSP